MESPHPKRLGKNKGGYGGATIHLESLLSTLEQDSKAAGWNAEHLIIQEEPKQSQLFLYRSATTNAPKVMLSGGIHGDEPASTKAICELIQEDALPTQVSLFVFPCLNPAGMSANHRENPDGIDLNRDYRKQQTKEVQTHVNKLNELPRFDVALHLHEDWEANGFYLYELTKEHEPSIYGRGALDKVSTICPVETAQHIEGLPADRGLIHPRHRYLDREDWPEAFYMMQHKTNHCLTIEAPSDFDLKVRVDALKSAVLQTIALLLGVSPNY